MRPPLRAFAAERHVPNCGTLWRGSGECWRLSNINQIVKLPREVSFAPLSQLIFTPTPSVLYACWCRWKCLSAATNVNEAKATSRRPEDGLKKGACVSDLLSSRLVMSGVVTCAERVLAPQFLGGCIVMSKSCRSCTARTDDHWGDCGAAVGEMQCAAELSSRLPAWRR